ncbi:MAG: glycosyltransferase family 2 protein [Acidobacteriota bacterium]|nr:glycosyltransferase family 2 protein [Acidobacteriota bacterium]
MDRVGIVIVTFNSQAEIGACLDSVQSTGAEIAVVDNASRDGTRAEVSRRNIRLIANRSNRGFAAAVNQGIENLTTPFILLLNADAVLLTGLDHLRTACEVPGIGGAGGRLVNPDGTPQTGFMVRRLPTPAVLCFEALLINRLWPRNPVNWRYRCLNLNPGEAAEVEQPAGAFLMIRRDVWRELGGFDENFAPLWFEDVDFCKRARNAGYGLRYVPEAVAKHTGAHSIRNIGLEIRQLYWYRSLLKYAAKHFRPVSRRLVCISVIFGSILRMGIGVFHGGSRKQIDVYGKVVRLAARELLPPGGRGRIVLF